MVAVEEVLLEEGEEFSAIDPLEEVEGVVEEESIAVAVAEVGSGGCAW